MDTNQTESTLAERIMQALFSSQAFEDNPSTEQTLAEIFGVSRTPVRDALKELEKVALFDGAEHYRHHRSYIVVE